jgi:hypothetical protein
MALIKFEELVAKIKLLLKELRRLQKQNKKYVLTLGRSGSKNNSGD